MSKVLCEAAFKKWLDRRETAHDERLKHAFNAGWKAKAKQARVAKVQSKLMKVK